MVTWLCLMLANCIECIALCSVHSARLPVISAASRREASAWVFASMRDILTEPVVREHVHAQVQLHLHTWMAHTMLQLLAWTLPDGGAWCGCRVGGWWGSKKDILPFLSLSLLSVLSSRLPLIFVLLFLFLRFLLFLLRTCQLGDCTLPASPATSLWLQLWHMCADGALACSFWALFNSVSAFFVGVESAIAQVETAPLTALSELWRGASRCLYYVHVSSK